MRNQINLFISATFFLLLSNTLSAHSHGGHGGGFSGGHHGGHHGGHYSGGAYTSGYPGFLGGLFGYDNYYNYSGYGSYPYYSNYSSDYNNYYSIPDNYYAINNSYYSRNNRPVYPTNYRSTAFPRGGCESLNWDGCRFYGNACLWISDINECQMR